MEIEKEVEEVKEVRKPIPTEIKVKMASVMRAYMSCGVIGSACHRANVTIRSHSLWLERYPAYREKINEIKERFIDGMEEVAMERAKEKSDSLLQLMLKSHRREIYGDKSDINVGGQSGKPMVTLLFNQDMLSDTERELLGANPAPDHIQRPPVLLEDDVEEEDEFADVLDGCDRDDDPDFDFEE